VPIVVYRIDMPPKGIEVTGEGTNPTDDEMREEEQARQEFLDSVNPKLASLIGRPPTAFGNVERVELFGTDVFSQMNHYLLEITTDVGDPRDFDPSSLVPHDGRVDRIGAYARLQSFPEEEAG
jgi:hypothetical protein